MSAIDSEDSPTFSILIPVHNAGGFLPITVRSVLAQTCSDFELILIDDGSSDGCLDPIADWGDDRIRILTQRQQGAPAALNAGLARARGRWIALLDHDDVWLPEKLATHRDAIAADPAVDLAFDWSRLIDAEGNDLGLGSRPWRGPITFEQLLEDFVIGNSSAMVIRRAAVEQVGGFNRAFPRMYDLDLCLRVASLRTGHCRAVPVYLTLYRRHAGQMSGRWRMLHDEWRRFLIEASDYASRPSPRLLRIADSNARRYHAWLACETGEFGPAVGMIASAFTRAKARSAVDTRNWMVLAAALGGLVLPPAIHRKALAFGKRLSGR